MLEQISTSLLNQSTELHFIRGTINNLERVLQAQENQKLEDWTPYTNSVLRELKVRVELLERSIARLTKDQEEAYKALAS